MKKIITTDKAPAAIGAYSQAVLSGSTLYISGQLPINPATGKIEDGIEEQTRRSMNNIQKIVEAAGGRAENIIKCGIFIKDMNDFAKMNKVYKSFFEKDFPARFVVEVSRLPKDVLIEIDAIAELEAVRNEADLTAVSIHAPARGATRRYDR